MINDELDYEVNERLKFKLKELEDGIKNRLQRNKMSAFSHMLNGQVSTSVKAQHYAEAWEEFLEVLKKETELPVPSSNMYYNKIITTKNNVTDDIMKTFDEQLRGTKEYNSNFRIRIQQKLADGLEKLLKIRI